MSYHERGPTAALGGRGHISPQSHYLLVLGLFALLEAGPSFAAIVLPQADGGALRLPAPARRIVTLAPNLAELVYAAGAGDRLKGVVEYTDFPPAASQLPKVGNAFRFDLERIVELKPDLVIAWQSGNPQPALEKLRQMGIRVWQLEITRPREIATALETIGKAAGTGSTGRKAAASVRARLSELKRDNAGKRPVTYFYQVATRPLYTINGQHIISRSLGICGGRNVFAALPALAPQVSREAVLMANPQVILSPGGGEYQGALKHWREWPQLEAVRNHALLYIDADEISRAGPRLLDGIASACRLLDRVRAAGSPRGEAP
ncbi:MAG: cobalamin-binding protein [Lysobacterales bacterium]|jgi:iron complex transport system substrate-binding protein